MLIDAEVEPDDINEDFVKELQQLEPFGRETPARFVIRGVEVESANLIGKEREHFKARLSEMGIEIIAFNRSDLMNNRWIPAYKIYYLSPKKMSFAV